MGTDDRSKLAEIARIIGAEVVETGGNIACVKVASSGYPSDVFLFGMEEESVGYDRELDGRFHSSGNLSVRIDASAPEIASSISAFMDGLEEGYEYDSRSDADA